MSVTREQVEKLMYEASQMESLTDIIVVNRRIFDLLLDERLVALNPVTQAKAEALLRDVINKMRENYEQVNAEAVAGAGGHGGGTGPGD